MRVFGIGDDGTFKEFVKTAFNLDHQEVVLEEWLDASEGNRRVKTSC